MEGVKMKKSIPNSILLQTSIASQIQLTCTNLQQTSHCLSPCTACVFNQTHTYTRNAERMQGKQGKIKKIPLQSINSRRTDQFFNQTHTKGETEYTLTHAVCVRSYIYIYIYILTHIRV